MLNTRDLKALEGTDLFRDLTSAQMQTIGEIFTRKRFPAHTVLMSEDQPGEVVYVILQGAVKISVQGDEDGEVILALRGAGESVGELSLVDGMTRSATVVTQEECIVAWADRAAFWAHLWEMPPFTYNLACVFSRRLRLAGAQIRALAALDVSARLAHQLLAFGQDHGQAAAGGGTYIPLRITQMELAAMVGASRVRVNQVLSYWKRRNYIAVDGNHRFTVLNAEALRRQCK